jgi:hypothetical protein
MSRFPTRVLPGASLGVAALALSATASAGVHFGIDVAVPVPAPVLVAPAPAVVAYPPVAPYYYGPHFYVGAPYYRHYWGPAYAYPHYGAWHGGYVFRDGHAWRR